MWNSNRDAEGIGKGEKREMARENKEKMGKTVRFSVRLPFYQHKWLKARSERTRGTNGFESMNEIISKALEEYIGLD